jgi:hypothetical protein
MMIGLALEAGPAIVSTIMLESDNMLDIEKFPHLRDPRIGVLIREGREVYYAHIDGEFPVRSTVDEVLVLLGVISAPEPSIDSTVAARYSDGYVPSIPYDLWADEKPGAKGEWRFFTVKVKNIDIPWEAPGYFTVKAMSERSALSCARKEMKKPDYHHTRREGRLRFSIDED